MNVPRAKFCWECGHNRILHRQCAESIRKGYRSDFISKADIEEELDKDEKSKKSV